MNGIGSKLTNFLSSWLQVTTYRDGKTESLKFEEGIFKNRTLGKQGTNHTGTIVEWKPNPEFFTHPQIDVNRIKTLFHVLTCLCVGLTINLTHNGQELISYNSKNGLNDLVSDIAKDNEIINNRLNLNYTNGKNKIDLVLTYTGNYSMNMISYVNNGETDSGPHITQIKTIITREFNKFFKEKKWLKANEDNLDGPAIQEGMLIAFNITAPGVSYDAQTKSRIVKLDMTPFTAAIAENIQSWLETNEREIKIIFDKAIMARKASEAAKKARDQIRNKEEKKKKALKFDSKLADANGKDRAKCEIYITEGDSASGNLKMARDAETQAVIPVRGKVLNCQKATAAQILKNAEIVTMMDAFFSHTGWGVDPKTNKIWYDTSKLRYGKIIIMSDADVDGAHIKNLFYTFIWNICPDLITGGYIYAGVPPLYKITEKNGKSYKYLKDDAALEEYRASHATGYQVGRMKGLGEMDTDETAECLTNAETRIIKQVNIADVAKANTLFNNLMGDGVVARKQFLKEYADWSTYNIE